MVVQFSSHFLWQHPSYGSFRQRMPLELSPVCSNDENIPSILHTGGTVYLQRRGIVNACKDAPSFVQGDHPIG
jgi:hypothetical protein